MPEREQLFKATCFHQNRLQERHTRQAADQLDPVDLGGSELRLLERSHV
jgi:hypothetical protein